MIRGVADGPERAGVDGSGSGEGDDGFAVSVGGAVDGIEASVTDGVPGVRSVGVGADELLLLPKRKSRPSPSRPGSSPALGRWPSGAIKRAGATTVSPRRYFQPERIADLLAG